MHTRHIEPGLISGWQITNDQGQHTAHIHGSRQDALDRAHHQLNTEGGDGGQVTIDDHDT